MRETDSADKKSCFAIYRKNMLRFIALYLVISLVISGYELWQEQKRGNEAFAQKLSYIHGKAQDGIEEELQSLLYQIGDSDQDTLNGNGMRQYYHYNTISDSGGPEHFPAAFLLAETEDSAESKRVSLEALLNKQELQTLLKAMDHKKTELPPEYRFFYQTENEGEETVLTRISLEKLGWSQNKEQDRPDEMTGKSYSWREIESGNMYYQTSGEIVWTRTAEGQDSADGRVCEGDRGDIQAPYYNDGYEAWKYWENNSFLQMTGEKNGAGAKMPKDAKYLFDYSIKGFWTIRMESVITVPMGTAAERIWVKSVRRAGVNTLTNLAGIYILLFFALMVCAVLVSKEQWQNLKKRRSLERDRMDFINGMAHELKTPLAAMRMCSDSLRVKELEHQKEYYLNVLEEKNREMDESVRQMILLSQMNADCFQPDKKEERMDVMVECELQKLEALIQGKNLTIHRNLSPAVWKVDRKYFRQVIAGLLENAAFYTEDGGTVRVILTEEYFRVENPCAPFSEEKLKNIFELFHSEEGQVQNGPSHLGFGLYLVKRVADLHGMTCTAGNTADGICFTIR